MEDNLIMTAMGVIGTLIGIGSFLWARAVAAAKQQARAIEIDTKIQEILGICETLAEHVRTSPSLAASNDKTNDLIEKLITGLKDEFGQLFRQQHDLLKENTEKYTTAMTGITTQLQVANDNQALLINALARKD